MHIRRQGKEELKACYPKYKNRKTQTLVEEYCEFRGIEDPKQYFGGKNWELFLLAIGYRNLLAHESTYLSNQRFGVLEEACNEVLRKLAKLARFALIAFVAFATLSTEVYAWGALQSQEVRGFSRYCLYSDGGVLTVGSTDLCPINNLGSDRNGSPTITIENRNAGFGSLTGQRVNGFSRYCSYSDGAVLTVGSTDLCPITSK